MRFPGGGGGGSSITVTAVKTANYTAAINECVRVDPTGGTFTVTLPTAVGQDGLTIEVKHVGGSVTAVTIDTTSSETIDDAASATVGTDECLTLRSDGADWMIV